MYWISPVASDRVARLVERRLAPAIAAPRPYQAQHDQRWDAIRRGHPGYAQNGGGVLIRSCPITLLQAGVRPFGQQVPQPDVQVMLGAVGYAIFEVARGPSVVVCAHQASGDD